jgi:hypothetical protein
MRHVTTGSAPDPARISELTAMSIKVDPYAIMDA